MNGLVIVEINFVQNKNELMSHVINQTWHFQFECFSLEFKALSELFHKSIDLQFATVTICKSN